MNLKGLIQYIMDNYDTSTKMKNNSVADRIRHGMDYISDTKKISSKRFKFYGSAGQGVWAEVPWIGLFDVVTFKLSAQQGVYLVYLLSSDHKRVYLSLNQGWTAFKNKYGTKIGLQKLDETTKSIRSIIRNKSLSHINKPIYNINLGSRADNPKGYEISNILSIEYSRENMPSNERMIDDLKSMKELLINVISNLKITYGKNVTYSTNDDEDLSLESNNLLDYVEPEPVPQYKKQNKINFKETYEKTDFEHIQKIKKFWGDNGEEWIEQIEKLKLQKCGRYDLAEKVEHVSKTKGDGLGYDIISFDNDGNKMFIEVKTTTDKSKDNKFQISINELNASKYYGNKYYIYRVYDFKNYANGPKYYILNGDMFNKLDLQAISFTAIPK